MNYTIVNPFCVRGTGLHSGKPARIRVFPAPEQNNIIFRCPDGDIPASALYASGDHATKLNKDKASVSTIEHLMAAAWCQNIKALLIEVMDGEIPIMDGSAYPWLRLFEEVGKTAIAGSEDIIVKKSIKVNGRNGSWALALPAHKFQLSIYTVFNNKGIGSALMKTPIENPKQWAKKRISSARTFVEENMVEILKQRGMALGGSLENAVVFRENGTIVNQEGLRYKDEPHRHKMLDALGDLSLSGNLKANIHIYKPGHDITTKIAREIINQHFCENYLSKVL